MFPKVQQCFKGQWLEVVFSLIASYLGKKERILIFFPCCANIYWVMARFNSFSALGEYSQWNFSVFRQAKYFNCILLFYGSNIRSHLTWLKYRPYKVLISNWKILAHSPNTLKEAKVRQKSKKNLNPYPISWIQWYGQKTISRYCPFNVQNMETKTV